jgi:hypothetical protein
MRIVDEIAVSAERRGGLPGAVRGESAGNFVVRRGGRRAVDGILWTDAVGETPVWWLGLREE